MVERFFRPNHQPLPDETVDPMLGVYQYMQVFGVSYTQAMEDPPDVRTKLLEIHSAKNKIEKQEQEKQQKKSKSKA